MRFHVTPCSTAHCRLVVTSEGTFCATTGVELHGPVTVCYDFTNRCNSLPVKIPKAMLPARRRLALSRKRNTELRHSTFMAAVTDMYGISSKRAAVRRQLSEDALRLATKSLSRPVTLRSVMNVTRIIRSRCHLSDGASPVLVSAAVDAIWAISKRLDITRTTHAGLDGFSAAFAATLVSKANDGESLDVIDRHLNTSAASAIRALSVAAGMIDTLYARFGVPCRRMSKLWREIKSSVKM